MLFVQGRRRNEGSYPPSLFESAYFVVVDFCSIQCIMGDALFSERDALELGGFFVDIKKEKGLESCSFMPLLVHMEGEK